MLITVRVSPEDRERLNRMAQERGETLSRMLVARWLPERKRARRQESARGSEVIAPAAPSARVCVSEAVSPVRPEADRKREAGGVSADAQGSLFDAMGGR